MRGSSKAIYFGTLLNSHPTLQNETIHNYDILLRLVHTHPLFIFRTVRKTRGEGKKCRITIHAASVCVVILG